MQTTANRPTTPTSEQVAVRQAHDKHVGRRGPRVSSPRHPQTLGERLSRRLLPLDFNKLCAQAVRRTGVEEFDSPNLAPALTILLDNLDQEAGLHPLGRFLMRTHLRDLLETRLRLADVWRARAEALEAEGLEQPFF